MSTVISQERPDTPDAIELVTELDAYLIPLYPIESHHGLDVAQLIREQIAFFVLRHDGQAAGCGGVKITSEYAEVKRMYVRPAFRGLGLSKRILTHLEDYARAQGAKLLRLEAGISQPEALGLYERMGFYLIPPFEPYQPDPLSVFYEKQL